ncbi:MAG: polymerase [Microvirga sp.]|jgi:predicted DNA-binding WGR domain protein|nr:polymerase [Microvirga sp.]
MSEEMIQFLVLDRRDPSCNMARFYVLAIEPNLFGSTTLIREWGRIGRRGQRRVEFHDNWMKAAEELAMWLRRKCKKG